MPPRVLLVEDNPLIVELLRQTLEEQYVLSTAVNGKLGIEAAKAQRPDLILMDLTMPVMDGWTAIAALRAEGTTRRIPIIALSGRDEKREIQRALDAGADCHISKPIDEIHLMKEMERLLIIARATSSRPPRPRATTLSGFPQPSEELLSKKK